MIRERWRAFGALLAASLWGVAAMGGDVPVPEKSFPVLEEILRTAAEQSPRMLARAIDLEIAENARVAARAGLLPSVGTSYRYYQAQDDRADQSETLTAAKVYYDFTVTQAVFHWGERRNQARIGEIQKELAQGGYREAYRGLAQELRQRYLGLVVKKLQLARARAALALSEQGLREGETRFAKQLISSSDLYSIRLGTEQSRLLLERTEFDYETEKAALARLAGLPAPLADDRIPDELPRLEHDAAAIERLLADFLAQPAPAAPEAEALRRQRRIEELNLKNHRTRLRPKVSAVAGVTQDEQSYTLNTAQRYRVMSLYGGLAVNWTLFDGHAARAATRNSLARLRQLDLDTQETVHRLGQQAQTQAKHLGFSARYMAMADHGLVGAEGSFRAKEDDLKRGLISPADLEAARIQVIETRLSAYSARIDYLVRAADFLGTVARDPVLEDLSLPQ